MGHIRWRGGADKVEGVGHIRWADHKMVECRVGGEYLFLTGDLQKLRKEDGGNVWEVLVSQLSTELWRWRSRSIGAHTRTHIHTYIRTF